MAQNSLIRVAGGIALFAAVWLGASVYLGRNAERELAERVQKTATDCGLRLNNLQQQSGLLSASGTLELQVGDLCDTDPSGKYWVVADVQYNINHLILPGSVMRFNWTLRQRPESGHAGAGLQLSGSGHSAFSGTLFSGIASTAISAEASDESWRLEPLTGHVEAGEQSLNLSLQAPRFTARGGGNALDLQGIGLQLNLLERELGLGSSSFTIDKVATSNGSGERLAVASETVRNGDRIDAKILYALGGLDAMGYSARDLAVEIAVRGLYADSVKTLAELAKESKSFRNLTQEENKRYRKALKQAINRGFSTGITKLSGSVGNAGEQSGLNGQLTIEVKPNTDPDADIQLAKMLQSSGQVSISGNAIGEEQKNQWLQMGIAKAGADGLQAGFDYSAGILKTNDRIVDEPWLQQTLAETDTQINRFLNETDIAAPAAGLENVIEAQAETDTDVDAPDPAPAAEDELQSVSMAGRVSYTESGAVMESADGRRLYFAVDSEIGQLIGGLCSEGETCAVTALVDGDGRIQTVQQLSAVAAPEPAPAAAQAVTADSAPKPSFDCAKAATKVEQLICGSNPLAAADAELAVLFEKAVAAAADGNAVVAEQRNWIKTVRNQCSDEPCLAAAYHNRIAELSQ